LTFLTDELSSAIDNSLIIDKSVVFTNVPRRKKEANKYGLDHAAALSKSLAKHYSAQYYQPLVAKSKLPQKKTVGEERIKNARFKIKRNAKELDGKTVIIVDDVVTTGASMGTCATLLKALGAKKIIGAVISIAYKDRYTPFSNDDRFYNRK
jgi:competence protein ComFC